MDAAKAAARSLLAELERHRFDATAGDGDATAADVPPAEDQGCSSAEALLLREARRRALFVRRGPRLTRRVPAPRSQENRRLEGELRALAGQLKKERAASERAASGAALRAASSTEEMRRRTVGGGPAEAEAVGPPPDEGGAAGGLTLASAASQIIMLRREVKYLQKQWNAARRDADGAARRDEVAALKEAAEAEAARAAKAAAAAAAAEARQRLLVRQVSALRAQLGAQQARIARRSAAQQEASGLRLQLRDASDALAASEIRLRRDVAEM